MNKCDLCGKEFEEFGNNPSPLKGEICCDQCNQDKVIPARFAQLRKDFNIKRQNEKNR